MTSPDRLGRPHAGMRGHAGRGRGAAAPLFPPRVRWPEKGLMAAESSRRAGACRRDPTGTPRTGAAASSGHGRSGRGRRSGGAGPADGDPLNQTSIVHPSRSRGPCGGCRRAPASGWTWIAEAISVEQVSIGKGLGRSGGAGVVRTSLILRAFKVRSGVPTPAGCNRPSRGPSSPDASAAARMQLHPVPRAIPEPMGIIQFENCPIFKDLEHLVRTPWASAAILQPVQAAGGGQCQASAQRPAPRRGQGRLPRLAQDMGVEGVGDDQAAVLRQQFDRKAGVDRRSRTGRRTLVFRPFAVARKSAGRISHSTIVRPPSGVRRQDVGAAGRSTARTRSPSPSLGGEGRATRPG